MDDRDSGGYRVEEIGADFGPEAAARAGARRNRTESQTPTGLVEHAVRMHCELIDDARTEAKELRVAARAEYDRIITSAQQQADKILEDARAQAEFQRSEQRAIASTTGELVAAQLSHLQTLNEVNEKLRQPVERPPTTAEVAGDVVKVIATLGQNILLQNPRLLQGAADRWGAATQRAAAGSDPEQPATPRADAAGSAVDAEFLRVKFSDIEKLLDAVGEDFVSEYAKQRGLSSFDEATLGDLRAIFCEVRRRHVAGAQAAAPGRGDAQSA